MGCTTHLLLSTQMMNQYGDLLRTHLSASINRDLQTVCRRILGINLVDLDTLTISAVEDVSNALAAAVVRVATVIPERNEQKEEYAASVVGLLTQIENAQYFLNGWDAGMVELVRRLYGHEE